MEVQVFLLLMLSFWAFLPECWLGILTVLSLFPLSLIQRQGLLSMFTLSIIGNFLWWDSNLSPWSTASSWALGLRGLVLGLTLILLIGALQDSPERWTLIGLSGWTSALMCLSTDLMTFFVFMEIQTLCLFVLIAYKTFSTLSTEAAIKYFVLGAFVSGLFLFGLALLYQTRGHLTFNGGEGELLNFSIFPWLLIATALLFKMAVAPFHQWAPDVYEGSPWITLLVLSSLPKLGIFSVLAQLPIPKLLLWSVGLFSLLWGAWGAFNQSKLRRLLAYSAIGHAGFIMLSLSLGSLIGYQMALLYLTFYILTFLTLVWVLETTPNLSPYWGFWAGLKSSFPFQTYVLAILLFSMAGIPPLMGFLTKWGVLTALVEANQGMTALIGLIVAAWAVGYYLRLIKQLTFEPHAQWARWYTLLQTRPSSLWVFDGIGLGVFTITTSLIWPFWYLTFFHYWTWCIA